ncbi:MAG: acyloxyacyl hydrolase [Desulfuromusa sp.]|nr:acyloxyacyl hydrolase [Desulfuromusa sp.]
MRISVIFLLFGVCLGIVQPVSVQAEERQYLPTRYGVALLAGGAYDPDNIGMVIVQGQMVADYKRFFVHRSPKGLRLKIEANLGLTTDGRQRMMFSLNMLALNYFENWQIGPCTPYVEAGIGAIYTDFKVDGQGSRINFNPQLGTGLEYPLKNGGAMTVGLRLHHISNGNLLKDNRGVNSALLQIGYLF